MSGVFNKEEGIDECIETVHHRIQIHDYCCMVTTIQKYVNSRDENVEWVYRYPINSNLYHVSVEIFNPKTNERKILKSKILPRKVAAEKYDDAISEGKSAVLVEKVPNLSLNVMSLGNIPGKAEVKIETSRVEKLSLRKSIENEEIFEMEFYLPAEDHEKDYGSKMLQQGSKPRKIVTLSGTCRFSDGVELKNILCPSNINNNEIKNSSKDDDEEEEEGEEEKKNKTSKFLSLSLEKGEFRTLEAFGQDKEFQLTFQFSKYPILSCWTELITTNPIQQQQQQQQKDDEDLYATLVTFLPQIKVTTEEENEKKREIIVIVDCSGSMSGSRINTCRRALQVFMNSLPTSKNTFFNIYRFGSTHTKLFSEGSSSMGIETHEKSMKYIQTKMNANLGGTDIYSVFEEIINNNNKNNKEEEEEVNIIKERNLFFFSDGEGDRTNMTIELVKNHILLMGRIFSFGIGNGINPGFLREISRMTKGNAVFFKDHKDPELQAKIIKQLQLSLQPSIQNVDVKLTFQEEEETEEEDNILLSDTTFEGFGGSCFNKEEQICVYLTKKKVIEVEVHVENIQHLKLKPKYDNRSSIIRYIVGQRISNNLERRKNIQKKKKKNELQNLGLKIGILNSQTSFVLTCPNDESFLSPIRKLTIPKVSYSSPPPSSYSAPIFTTRTSSSTPTTTTTGVLSVDQKEELRQAFHLFDKDSDGTIDRNELLEVLVQLGTDPTDEDIDDMLSEVDSDNNGLIDFEDFVSLMGQKMQDVDKEQEIREAFALFDKGGDGRIDGDGLKCILKILGEYVSEEEVQEMMDSADRDGDDGMLDYEEFRSLMLSGGDSTPPSSSSSVQQKIIPQQQKKKQQPNKNKFNGRQNIKGGGARVDNLQELLIHCVDMMGKFRCDERTVKNLFGDDDFRVLLEKIKKENHNDFWMTALVIAFLQIKMMKRRNEWVLIAQKSVKLLKENKVEGLIEKAKVFLRKEIFGF